MRIKAGNKHSPKLGKKPTFSFNHEKELRLLHQDGKMFDGDSTYNFEGFLLRRQVISQIKLTNLLGWLEQIGGWFCI